MEEKQFRDKIYWLTFLFSLLVVWVHSFNGELFIRGPRRLPLKVAGIERILGERLGQIAVPGFFMVSSYLFFAVLLGKAHSKVAFQDKKPGTALSLWNFLYYIGYVAATACRACPEWWERRPYPLTGPSFLTPLCAIPITRCSGICSS